MAEQSNLNEMLGGYRKLMAYGERVAYPKNTIVMQPGDDVCTRCYVLAEGQVIGFAYTETGAEHDFIIHDSPNMFLETQVLLGKPVPAYFKTTKQSELIALERDVLLGAMREDFEIALLIARILGGKFDYAMMQIRKKNAYSSMWQLCDLLLDLASRYGNPCAGKVMIMEKISQQMMGNLLHVNRITVVRNLAELKNNELIEQVNGFYCIRDTEALRRYQNNMVI